MSFNFQLPKVVQEVGVLLAQTPNGRHNYTCLLKLLYIADRESLADTGQPISGDTLVAMPKGPALSHVCDLMRGSSYAPEDQAEYWAKYFETDGLFLVLKQEPDTTHLSDFEVEKLQSVYAAHGGKSVGEMFAMVDELPEVKKNKCPPSSKIIPLEDILSAIGREKDSEEINRNRIEDNLLSQFFGS